MSITTKRLWLYSISCTPLTSLSSDRYVNNQYVMLLFCVDSDLQTHILQVRRYNSYIQLEPNHIDAEKVGYGITSITCPGEKDGGSAQGSAASAASEQPASPEAGSAAAASDTRPGGGLGNPIDTPDPLTKYRWWILGSLSLVLAAAAAFFLRSPAPTVAGAAIEAPVAAPFTVATTGTFANAGSLAPTRNPHSSASASESALLAALKEELFAVETERLQGKLAEDDYAQLKGALETVLRRALNRQNA